MTQIPKKNKNSILKIVFFGNSRSFISIVMLKALIKMLRKRRDVSLLAVVDAAKQNETQKRLYKKRCTALLKYIVKFLLFNSKNKTEFVFPGNFYKIASKTLPIEFILSPPKCNINDPLFISKLKALCPDVAFSIACPQKFRKELLGTFINCVNYHDSLLPKYRGINSTAISLYYGEKTTGYTFHYMDQNFDTGNILVQGDISLDYNHIKGHKSVSNIKISKTIMASKQWNKVIDCLLRNEKGIPQEGKASYFGKKKIDEIVTVSNRFPVDSNEIYKKLIFFRHIKTSFRNEIVYATDVQVCNGYLKIKSINDLPIWIWILLKILKVRK